MKTSLERIQKNEVALEIEVDADQLEKALQIAYRKTVSKVNVPGFRKGKAPRAVLEAFVGRDALITEALEEVVPEAYEAAVLETEIEPVADPRIEVVQAEDGKPLVFKAIVVVKPEVVLGDLSDIKAEVPKIVVSEDDVNTRLDMMRNRYARIEKAEDDAEALKGDVLTIDFVGYQGDVAFEGGSGADYSLELGSNTFIPGFEDQLVGAKAGEEKEVNVTFPEEYHSEDLAGKDARFVVNVKEIKRRVLSTLDDDFAKDVSEFDTLEELLADIRANLDEMAEKQNKQNVRDQVVARVSEKAEIDIPREMIDAQIDMLLMRMNQRLSSQGLDLTTYMQLTGESYENLRSQVEPQAVQVVRDNLVLEQIAKEKEIVVTDEDFAKEISKAAEEMNVDIAEIEKNLGDIRPRLEQAILMDKVVDFLTDKAEITYIEG